MIDERERSARNWALLCHLAALLGWVGIPLGNILGPLVVWLLKKNEFELVDDQGKEALNFQISLTLYGLLIVLAVIVSFVSSLFVLLVPLLALLVVLALLNFVLLIVAAVRVSNGERHRYPFVIQFIK